MVEVEFQHNTTKSSFIAQESDTVKEVINKANIKYITNDKEFLALAHNKKINLDKTIESLMTEEDKKTKKIKIFIIPLETEKNPFKDFICPECLKPCHLSLKNYRINLSHASGLHNIDNIKFSEFEKNQKDLFQKLNCNICKEKKRIFECSQCDIYLCQECKNTHDNKSHKISNSEEIKYICNIHEQTYIKFCNQCDENICELCEKNEHSGHFISDFKELSPNIDGLYENLRKLKTGIDTFNNNIKEIIQKLNKVKENMEIIYKINENIINSYSNSSTNYVELLNVIDINNFINKELENLEEYDYGYNINKVIYLYNEMEEKNQKAKLNYEFISFPENGEDVVIPIFGEKFINNNLYKCKIIFNEYEYDLSHKFYSSDLSYDYGQLSLIIKGINNIINMSSMFEGCDKIKELYGLTNIDTSKVINMKNLFYDCPNLKSLPDMNKWNTSNVMNMEGMFNGNRGLQFLPDISKWDTSKVTSMIYMFYNCENLISLPDISKWNISNNIDMRYMFCNCSKLTSFPDLSKWNPINVKYMTSLFKDCFSLISLPDISKWNTSNVMFMNDLFQNCPLLTVIPDISKWNVSNCSDFSYSFMGCISLVSLPDITKWEIKKCRNLDGMFIGCSSLCSLPDFDKWEKYTINNKHSMFKRCFNSLNFPLLGYDS